MGECVCVTDTLVFFSRTALLHDSYMQVGQALGAEMVKMLKADSQRTQ